MLHKTKTNSKSDEKLTEKTDILKVLSTITLSDFKKIHFVCNEMCYIQ